MIIVIHTWFPKVLANLDKHKALAQGIYFTGFFFGVLMSTLWGWHRRRMFWASFSILLVLHVTGILLFTARFRPLLVSEWTALGISESFVAVAFVYWMIRRFGHSHRHEHSRLGGDQGSHGQRGA